MTTDHPDLPTDLRGALERAVDDTLGGPPLLVASDFDGVLAPLVDDPSASRPTDAADAALRRLAVAAPDRVRVALVSGRNLDSLTRLTDPPAGTLLVGSHGAERADVHAAPDGTTVVERVPFHLTAEEGALLGRVRTGLAQIADPLEGAWVEDKPSAAVLHTRRCAPEDGTLAARAAVELGEGLGAHTMSGKDVVEIAVTSTSKGVALTALRDELGLGTVFYMGDDVTDERAFEVLEREDLTVKVGSGETAARFRVADPDAAAAVLTVIADRLEIDAARS
ncbi:trehalose-phosphatase [Oerskovia flava]|uniref:trehalose-phosphatase n=1 Tax=Oerskovia flava TaxID=2986422 RepID=UPI00224049D8|nr:trehalose-phosphatase [Oerskovia sp. JB1-3-2]